jgi:hypothetical protein
MRNGNVVAFTTIAGLFAFAVTAFVFADFWYCLAFLATLGAVFHLTDPRHDP